MYRYVLLNHYTTTTKLLLIRLCTLLFIEDEKNNDELVRNRLNEKLFAKMQQIEARRLRESGKASKYEEISIAQRVKLAQKKKKEELVNLGRDIAFQSIKVSMLLINSVCPSLLFYLI